MKKIIATVIGSAFAAVLAAPVAMACPGENKVVKKEDKSDQAKTAEKAKDKKAQPEKAKPAENTKVVSKKVVEKG